MSGWDEYTALTRHLDHLRQAEDASVSGLARQQDSVSIAANHLEQRLAAQHERIVHLGREIRQHVSSRPVPPSSVADPATAARLGLEQADVADAELTAAEELARRAPLLPGASPVIRNLLVYLGCALVAVAVQFGLLAYGDNGRMDQFALLAWVLGGLPAIAFFAGYLVIRIWGRPKLMAGTTTSNPRLGFAICLFALPTLYCGIKVFGSLGG
jgi:hypothetical protein